MSGTNLWGLWPETDLEPQQQSGVAMAVDSTCPHEETILPIPYVLWPKHDICTAKPISEVGGLEDYPRLSLQSRATMSQRSNRPRELPSMRRHRSTIRPRQGSCCKDPGHADGKARYALFEPHHLLPARTAIRYRYQNSLFRTV